MLVDDRNDCGCNKGDEGDDDIWLLEVVTEYGAENEINWIKNEVLFVASIAVEPFVGKKDIKHSKGDGDEFGEKYVEITHDERVENKGGKENVRNEGFVLVVLTDFFAGVVASNGENEIEDKSAD